MRRFSFVLVPALVMATLLAAFGGDNGKTPATPAYAAGLKSNIENIIRKYRVPSAVVVVKSPKGDWTGTFGTRTLDGGDPVTADDHYRVGSVTKTMTGTIILQLAQEGKLGLDDPVSKYVPNVPGGDKVTIAQLLEMRSGLHNFTTDPDFLAELRAHPDKVWRPSELLQFAFAKPPSFPPGQDYEYSNTNYVLAGLIIEKVTGQPYEDELKRRIFDPLGLGETSYPAPDDTSIPSPHPHGYDYVDESELEAQRSGKKPEDFTDFNFPSGADGRVISTAKDMATYAEALGDGTLLSPELQRERIASIQSPGRFIYTGYGLGIAKDGPWLGHTGVVPGFNTAIWRDPKERNTVVVLTSTQLRTTASGAVILPAFEMVDAATTALYGKEPPEHPSKGGRASEPIVLH